MYSSTCRLRSKTKKSSPPTLFDLTMMIYNSKKVHTNLKITIKVELAALCVNTNTGLGVFTNTLLEEVRLAL